VLDQGFIGEIEARLQVDLEYFSVSSRLGDNSGRFVVGGDLFVSLEVIDFS
jgi:hypothetical protein